MKFVYIPGRDGTRNAARRPGSGGCPRGCGFEEQGGGMCAYTEGGLSPLAILFVCLSVRPNLNCQIIQIKHTHYPAPFSNTPITRMPPPRCLWVKRPIHARCPKRLPLGAKGVCSKASKCKLPTTQNRHRRRHRRRHHPPVTVEGARRGTRHLQAAEPRRCGKWGKGRAGLVEHRNERPGNTRVPPRLPLSDT